ncbi:chromate efflux transporter [Paraflavisolibacter sp. H34]|uniref:chromate efflux transporter n=1 Tax=Huijunlia imazamoxiresistens TaxID=3127457 RepID=UPI003019AEB7
MKKQSSLKDVAGLFLKLGLIGFGGPAVHIALMEEEVVRKRGWMDHPHFLDLVGATNLIPGPNSTEMTMHIGHERAGWKGLVVAGCCFIFPAVLLTALFAWAYRVYGTLPQVQPFIYGIKPAIIAVIVALMIGLGKKALKSVSLGIIGLAAAVAVLAGWNEIAVLFGAGFLGMALHLARTRNPRSYGLFPFALLQAPGTLGISAAKLFWIFLKIGSILYGSGYVLFAFLDAELVAKGLLTKQQLIDAVAVGQFTPGPVFSSATFIGWQIGGPAGALAATVGIFLPSFLFVAFLNPLVPRLRKSPLMAAFLDTVNIVSIGIILSVVVEMSRATLLDWRTVLIAVLSFIVTFSFKKWNTAFIILGGAVLGYALSFF